MRTEFRVSWPANVLCEKFRLARAAYEKSDDYDCYQRSGQNSLNYYPDFNRSNNPSFVMMHYLFRGLPRGSVMGDLPDDARRDTTNVMNESRSDTDDTDENDFGDEEEQTDAPPRVTRSLKSPAVSRSLCNSPASSIASSASTGRGRGRHGRSLNPFGDVGKTLKKACDQILSSFNRMEEDNRRQQQRRRRQQSERNNDCDVTTKANNVMELIQTKRKVVEELTLLRGTDGFGAEVKLLELQLCELSAEIQKRVQTHTNNDLC